MMIFSYSTELKNLAPYKLYLNVTEFFESRQLTAYSTTGFKTEHTIQHDYKHDPNTKLSNFVVILVAI